MCVRKKKNLNGVCMCVCGREGGGGWRGRQAHCGHANVVDRKHGHKDVMRLNVQKQQRQGVSRRFSRHGRPRPTQKSIP